MEYLYKYEDEYKDLPAGHIAHMYYLFRYHNKSIKEAIDMVKTMSFEELDEITHINDKFNVAIEGLNKYIFNGIDFPKMEDTYQALRGDIDDIDLNKYLRYIGEQIIQFKCENQGYTISDFKKLLCEKIGLIINDLHNKIVSDGAKSIEEATTLDYLYYSLPTFFVSINDLHEEMCIMDAILRKFGYPYIQIDYYPMRDRVEDTMLDTYELKQCDYLFFTLHFRNDEQMFDYLKNIDKHYPSININKEKKEVTKARLEEYKKDDVIKQLVKKMDMEYAIDWEIIIHLYGE